MLSKFGQIKKEAVGGPCSFSGPMLVMGDNWSNDK